MRNLGLCTTALLLTLLPGLLRAQPADAPRQLIDRLGVQTRVALEQSRGSLQSAENAERAVAETIRAWVRRAPGDDALHDGDELGRTPLMQAVSGGYLQVVSALLEDPIVRALIHTRNRAGDTAWTIAATVPTMALPACHPGVLTVERQALLWPYALRMSALHRHDAAALRGIVQALQAAGARREPEAARDAWLARCPDALPQTRARIAAGRLPEDLIDEAVQRVQAYSQAGSTAAATLPQRPAAGVRVTPADPARHALATRPVSQLHCASRPAPALPGLSWSGRLTIQAQAVTRAGIVEAADLEVAPADADPVVADYFRKLVLQALAAYRCEGDVAFAQTFSFRVD